MKKHITFIVILFLQYNITIAQQIKWEKSFSFSNDSLSEKPIALINDVANYFSLSLIDNYPGGTSAGQNQLTLLKFSKNGDIIYYRASYAALFNNYTSINVKHFFYNTDRIFILGNMLDSVLEINQFVMIINAANGDIIYQENLSDFYQCSLQAANFENEKLNCIYRSSNLIPVPKIFHWTLESIGVSNNQIVDSMLAINSDAAFFYRNLIYFTKGLKDSVNNLLLQFVSYDLSLNYIETKSVLSSIKLYQTTNLHQVINVEIAPQNGKVMITGQFQGVYDNLSIPSFELDNFVIVLDSALILNDSYFFNTSSQKSYSTSSNSLLKYFDGKVESIYTIRKIRVDGSQYPHRFMVSKLYNSNIIWERTYFDSLFYNMSTNVPLGIYNLYGDVVFVAQYKKGRTIIESLDSNDGKTNFTILHQLDTSVNFGSLDRAVLKDNGLTIMGYNFTSNPSISSQAGIFVEFPVVGMNSSRFCKINLSPNPTYDQLNIITVDKIENYKIYNLQGSLIKIGKVDNNNVSVIDLVKGFYIIQMISMDGDVYNKRFFKEDTTH